jgi:hypothetical protein
MDLQERIFPELIRRLHELEFDYADGEGIDFEPYNAFLSSSDTQEWFQVWTGNEDVDGRAFFVFGEDGTGGYAAIWHVRESEALLAQPVVFFGSEGELGVIAPNFSDYLWLLASGHGPYEAVAGPDDARSAVSAFLEFARQNATTPQAKPTEIIARAKAEFPDFERSVKSLCK